MKLILGREYTLLGLILIIAFALRVINVSNNPPSLYGDELTLVYDSYSLLKTGHDQTGQFLPLTFHMREGSPAGYGYFSIPFVAIFGPTSLGVRLLSVFSGVGIVFLIYLLSKSLISKQVGIIVAVLMAISPWAISISRGGFEANFALFLSLLSIVCFLYAPKKPLLYILSAFFLGLSIHTYQPFRLTLPLFFILLFFWRGNIKSSLQSYNLKGILAVIIAITFIFTVAYQTLFSGSETRFVNLNLFGQENLKQQIIQEVNLDRNLSQLPYLLSIIFHNRYIEYIHILTSSYLDNFSLNFLVISGDSNPRHNMGEMGGLYFIQFIAVVIGLVSLWLKGKRLFWLFIGWIIISPIPSVLLSETHFLRGSFMLLPLTVVSALGLYNLLIYFKDKPLSKYINYGLILILIIQFVIFVNRIYFVSPKKFQSFWSYEAKQVSQIAKSEKNNYKYIILSARLDDVEFAYPVYNHIEPSLIIEQNKNRSNLLGYKFKKLDNVYIGSVPHSEIAKFIEDLDGSVLYIGYWNESKYLKDYSVVYGSDNSPKYLISKKSNDIL